MTKFRFLNMRPIQVAVYASGCFLTILFCTGSLCVLAQEIANQTQQGDVSVQNTATVSNAQQSVEATVPEPTISEEQATVPGNVTLDFKDADIRNVLRIISFKGRVNIVPTPEVAGLVSVRLVDVPWEKALDIILRTYGFAYEKKDNVIMVAPLEKLTAQKKQEVELAQVQPTVTEVFNLKFLDAQDAKKALESQLSPRGKITVLEMTGQGGWEFGGAELGKRARKGETTMGRSKVMIISDIPPVLEKMHEIVTKIDIKPLQVLLETKILEVSRDRLKDLGIDLGTGSTGAESAGITGTPFRKNSDAHTDDSTMGGHSLGSLVTPSIFGPKAGITGAQPFNSGLELVFKNLTGAQFEVILHALEEDVYTNTLSAPRIITLNNQEATILVGTKYPILSSEASTQSQYTVTQTLNYYQDIGIQLNIVPQVSAEDYVNIVLHPAITSYTTTVGTNLYPIINTRELETRILMKSGDTVAIGGLLKDVKNKSEIGIPIISKIPIIGGLFTRKTDDTEKIDLIIFITAKILTDETASQEDLAKLDVHSEKRTQKSNQGFKK